MSTTIFSCSITLQPHFNRSSRKYYGVKEAVGRLKTSSNTICCSILLLNVLVLLIYIVIRTCTRGNKQVLSKYVNINQDVVVNYVLVTIINNYSLGE